MSSSLHELRNTGSTESEASMLPWSMHALSSQMVGAADMNLCSKSLAYLRSPSSRQDPVSALDARSAAVRLLSGSTRNISLAVLSAWATPPLRPLMRDARAAASCSCVPLAPRLPSQRCSRPRLRGVHRAADTNMHRPATPRPSSVWTISSLSSSSLLGRSPSTIKDTPIKKKRARTIIHRRRRAARGGIVWRPWLLQRSVDAVQIAAKAMMPMVPAHAPDVVLGERKALSAQEPNKVKSEKKMTETSRMSFASIGCTLSIMRKTPGASNMKNHVLGMVIGSKRPLMPLTVHPIVPKKYTRMQTNVHPRPRSTRLIRACKRAAVSVAFRSLQRQSLSEAGASVSLVAVARDLR
eukprot:scaffold104545_cov69-Phaeocystis_antarctica.AAC.4